MVFAEIFTWWYVQGWRTFLQKNQSAFSSITDFFSMGSLLKTLFKPFRQIASSTAGENASIDLRFHMFIDRLISRCVGFFSRLILLIIGLVIIILGGTISLVLIIAWPFIPLLPVAGIILTVSGVIL